MKTRTITEPIYRFTWYLCFGGKDANEGRHYYAKETQADDFPDYPCDQVLAQFGAKRPLHSGYLWFRERKPNAPTVAHEAFHATMYLFEQLDMKGPTDDTEEIFAYYMEWIVKEVLK